jgi:hypothetical protein
MKFAFVSTMASVPWGGSEVLWSEACRRLATDGHEVFIWYPRWPTLPAPLDALASELKVEITPYSAHRSFTERLAGSVRRNLHASTGYSLHFKRERDRRRDVDARATFATSISIQRFLVRPVGVGTHAVLTVNA